MPPTPARSAAPSANGMRHFRFLVAGNAVSSYGSFLNMVALNLYAYQLTGSALQTGLFMALRLAFGVLAGLVAGRISDRFGDKAIMLATSLVQAAAMAALVIAPGGTRQAVLYALAVITGASGTLFTVAMRSAVPAIVGVENRQRANGLVVTGRAAAMVAGFASAGLVISWFDYRAAFLVDAATFLVSAAVTAALPIGRRTAGTATTAAAPPFRLRTLAAGTLAIIAIHGLIGLGSGAFHVALPVHSTAVDPVDPAAFVSRFWTAWAVGSIIAHQLVNRLGDRVRLGGRFYVASILAMSLTSISVYLGMPLVPTLAAAALTGLASGLGEIAYSGRIQLLPDNARARAFGVSTSTESAGFGAGMMCGAFLLGTYTPLTVVAALSVAAVVLAAGFAALAAMRPRTPMEAVHD